MRHAVLVLSVVGALLGAPRSVTAAGNALTAVPPSPATGSPSTVVTFGVAYEGRFPAQAVTATIAGTALPMRLVSGTAAAGTWRVATTLPAGTWTATFTANVSQGNAPTATSSQVTISTGSATPVPAAPNSGRTVSPSTHGPAPDVAAPDAAGAPGGAPATPAPAAPAPASPAAVSPGVPEDGAPTGATPPPSGAPDAQPAPPAAGNAGPSASAGTGGAAPTPGTRSVGRPSGSGAPGSGRPSSGEPSAAVVETPLGDPAGWAPNQTLVVVLVGMAAVSMLCAGGFLAARRRSRSDGPASATSETLVAARAPVRDDDRVDANAVRRHLRRPRAEDEDPIVAAMGIGSDGPRIDARGRNDGPRRDAGGERPGRR